MNKKGFTLVELMGILVILGVMLVFTVPAITKTLKNSEANEMAEYEKTVCMAAQTYVEVKRYSYPKTIKFKTLRDNGYLSTTLKNPKTETLDSDNKKVTIKSSSGNISCTFSS